MKTNDKILLAIPSLAGEGGVANFYNAILPHFTVKNINLLEIGRLKNSGGVLHPLIDQIRFYHTVASFNPSLINLNPSLGLKSFVRDGLFVWQTKLMRKHLLIFWHGWDKDFEKIVEKKLLPFFKNTFGKADGFIVLASEFEQKLRDWDANAPIYKLTTCVDDKLLDDIDILRKWNTFEKQTDIKLLFLARLERAKGIFETIKAFQILLEKRYPVLLTIAGDGKIRSELEEYVNSLNLHKRVNFTGYIRGKEKVEIFNSHHIYCFPTNYGEGLPTSVLEAMAFGMPIVTTSVGGLSDIFEDNKMGFLVKSTNPDDIANSLEQLLLNRTQMIKIGRCNAEYARKHFMASVVAKKMMTIYSQILSNV